MDLITTNLAERTARQSRTSYSEIHEIRGVAAK